MKVGVANVHPGTPVADIARLFKDKGLEAVVILDPEEGHAVGVVSQKELAAAFVREGLNARFLKAEDIMCDDVPQVPPDIPLEAAFQIMLDKGVRMVFLMHHAGGVTYSAGALSYNQLVRFMAAQSDEEISDLGTMAERKNPLDAFIQKRDAARRARTNQ